MDEVDEADVLRPTAVRGEDGSPLRSYGEAAAYLGVPEETLRYWNSHGRGPRSYKIGRYRRFKIADLDDFIEQRAQEAGTSATEP